MTDEQLVKKMVETDCEESFEKLYKRYYTRVFHKAYQIFKDREQAKDVTQEIFVILYNKVHTFRGESKFSTWFFRVAHNRFLEVLQSEKSQARWKKEFHEEQENFPEVHEDKVDFKMYFWQIFNGLSQNTILIDHLGNGTTATELGRKENLGKGKMVRKLREIRDQFMIDWRFTAP